MLAIQWNTPRMKIFVFLEEEAIVGVGVFVPNTWVVIESRNHIPRLLNTLLLELRTLWAENVKWHGFHCR